MESYTEKDNKILKRGYTTGTCAAAAACAATALLLSEGKEKACSIRIITPKEVEVNIPVEELYEESGAAVCSVKKYSGDDPDVTNGALVYAQVKCAEGEAGEIKIDGGVGVGRVTKPGLACAVGEAAINPVPRRMITEEVRRIAERFGYEGCLEVIISIPDGVKLAEKTFNPKLGIVGGISVLGTSGIVEPMSEQALIDTIKVEMNVAKAAGAEYLIITPGNYGESFLKRTKKVRGLSYVKCSNFIGDALEYAAESGFRGVLLVGHIGKLIKVAAGVMNTHSKYGDGRMETLSHHINLLGENGKLVEECVTTEDAVKIIRESMTGREKELWESVLKSIKQQMEEKTGKKLLTEAMIYSNQLGYLGETPGTEAFLSQAEKKEENK
ncbi:MAG: cobalt-precorrin-5B (C(1))-methyltransferase CbiD [Anaerovoracaceae bacterium]